MKFETYTEQVLQYHEELCKIVAMSVVPPEIHKINNQVEQLNALLKWFKNDFFTWTNRPNCLRCGTNNNLQELGHVHPNNEDREYGASRVEGYKCLDCRIITRFPRYNSAVKLFETRTGRCGEWANAFTALCVAMGYTARLVLDWTDHVWTEVYIEEWQRWVHCDSCEPLFDKPLTYEKGWGKQLTYIVAFSNQEIVDVTRRYVIDPFMNKMRRNNVNEKWLADLVKQRREMLWDMQGPEMAAILRDRYFREEKELFGDKDEVADEDYLPRQSGSLEWRSGRGEMGKGVMDSTAGSATIKTREDVDRVMKDMHRDAARAKQEEAKRAEVARPQLPERPEAELYAEA